MAEPSLRAPAGSWGASLVGSLGEGRGRTGFGGSAVPPSLPSALCLREVLDLGGQG